MDAILSALAAEVDSLKAQLAAANAQRDELLRAATRVSRTYPSLDTGVAIYELRDVLVRIREAIARAQSGQPKKLTTHDDLRAAGVENHDVGRTCFHCGGDVPSGFKHEHADGACKQSGQPAQRDDDGTASGGGQP